MTSTGFVGVDPRALEELAELAERCGARIAVAASEAVSVLERQGRCRAASDVGVGFGLLESRLVDDAEGLRWRSGVIQAAQRISCPMLVENRHLLDLAMFASPAILSTVSRGAAFHRWMQPPDVAALARMTPAEVAAAFEDLAPSVRTGLATKHPALMGRLDGVPPEVRYAANRILIEREIERLDAQIAEIERGKPGSVADWLDLRRLLAMYPVGPVADSAIAPLEARRDAFVRWLAEGRQILLFDPTGDGRVVEVFGDLAAAEYVGVVVPGISNDIANFSDGEGGFRANALRLIEASRRESTAPVATIAWLGYDPPDNVGAVTRTAADGGAPALRSFLEGIDPAGERTVTVVAHSYGSVLAGTAARDGIEADNLVVVGSPGTTLDHASEAELRPGGRVWSALADSDPIGLGVSPGELVPPWLPPFLGAVWLTGDLLFGGPEDLWHGANPAGEEFGATRISTDGSSGHSSYFEEQSLLNLARIVQGRYDEVDLKD